MHLCIIMNELIEKKINMRLKQIIVMLLCASIFSTSFAQTPRPNIVLSEEDSGTKDYVARDFVRLTSGFKYTAIPGTTFKARINTGLSFTTFNVENPKPGQVNGESSTGVYVPGGSFSNDPVSQIAGITSLVLKQKNALGAFDTIKTYIYPIMWFKTVPQSNNLNGLYVWKDICQKPARLQYITEQGYGDEVSIARDKLRTYNFYPSMDISYAQANKVITQSKTDLAQSTIIGAWGMSDNFYTQNFMFAIKGRLKDTVLFSNSKISYPKDLVNNLDYHGFKYEQNIDSVKFREKALRIGSYYRAKQPNNSLWQESIKADIVLGGKFDATIIHPTNAFNNSADWTALAPFKGGVPELFVFDRRLTENEIAIYETYLALKYGITRNKSYISHNGKVLWDSVQKDYHNRVFGYGRVDALGLDQKMSTTSHEEFPYYTDLHDNDSYELKDSYNASTKKRLLVAGTMPANTLADGEYIIMGDNDKSKNVTLGLDGFGGVMQREWYVARNVDTYNNQELSWDIDNMIKIGNNNVKSTFLKYSGNNVAIAKTSTTIKGNDGYLAWTVEQEYGPILVGFASQQTITSHNIDYGYSITVDGHVKLINNGMVVNDSLFTVSKGQRVEVEKRAAVMFLRINGVRYKNTELQLNNDNFKSYYGVIMVKPSAFDIKISNVRHGGFVDTGHRLELSYFVAPQFNPQPDMKYYLRHTSDGFTNDIISDEVDLNRNKIIFNNIYWKDGDKFTFAYKSSAPNNAKKNVIVEEELEYKDDIRVYYKDPADRKNITVRVETARPSAATIYVFDMAGRRMERKTLAKGCEARFADINIRMSGVYIVKIVTNDNEYSKKIIVN